MQTTTLPSVPAASCNTGAGKLSYGSDFHQMFSFKVLLFAIGLLLGTAVLAQTTYYVKTTGDDAGNGTSWAGAFRTLQRALSTVGIGDQVWVAEGTYYPDEGPGETDNSRNSSFYLRWGVAIYGGFAGTETQVAQRNWQTHVTILSGDLQQNDGANFANAWDNAWHVVIGNGTDNTAVLDGFTIKAGTAIVGEIKGGGMYNEGSSSPTLTNCSFSGNYANLNGGGMYNEGSSSPTLTNCSFLGNTANAGGGIYNQSSSPTLTNCSFSGNNANVYGGGIYNSGSSPTLTNCSFSGNNAAYYGGGILNATSSPTLTNCILWGNTSAHSPEMYNNVTPIVSYSIVKGGYAGTGNLDQDPLFVDAANGNLHLQACSPAIDAGSDAANNTTTDLDGSPRKVRIIDMGAYEFQGTPMSLQTYYRDNDQDNYGDSNNSVAVCSLTPPTSYVSNNTDCNDADVNEHPGQTWYIDNDDDGYAGSSVMQCSRPVNGKVALELSSTSIDCDDNNATLNPSTLWYKDVDNDGYSDGNTKMQCARPSGYKLQSELIQTSGDCNDNDPGVHNPITYYRDADGDGFGSSVSAQFCSSTAPAGYSARAGDFNDNDPAISPAAVEVCGNKVDDNCNGIVDESTCYACQNGTNLTSVNITSNSAQLNWNATANSQQWQLQYKTTASGSKWIDVLLTGNIRSVKISSLKANQTYNWHIRAKCNGTWTAYSSSATFKTAGSISSSIVTSAVAAKNSTFSLYPNPTTGQFVIELNVANKMNTNAKIQLIDLTGKTVQTESAEINSGSLKKTMNVSSALAKGIYMVRIMANDRVFTAKLVYEK